MKKLLLSLSLLLCLSVSAQNKVKYVSSNTSAMNLTSLNDNNVNTVITRQFLAGYNTLCLPFTLDKYQLSRCAKDLKIERLAGVGQEGSTLCLYFIDCTNEGIESGMPYLIFSPKAQFMRVMNTDAIVLRDDIKVVRMNDNAGNQVSFSSSWTLRTKEGLYGIPAQQNVAILESILIKTTAEHSILPTRCGFSWEHQAATATTLEIKHVSASEATAIRTTMTNDNERGDVYNLSGHHLTPSAKKGLYIQNGKKGFGK